MEPQRIFSTLSLLGALLFAIAHTQPQLYYSNQNQYFLHGLAQAGVGNLSADWLANTHDPTPVFSWGIQHAHALGTWTYQAAFFVLLVVYFLSLWATLLRTSYAPKTVPGQLLLFSLIILSHSGIARAGSVALFGVDYPWYFQAGVANQYLLGAGLQPSVFGVLLLTALAACMHDRPLLAGALAAVTCAFHATYLLHSGALVLGIMWNECSRKRYQSALMTGLLSLLLVLPIVWHVQSIFAQGPGKLNSLALEIIAWKRIPHHCDINRWLDIVAVLQLCWSLWVVILLSRTVVFRPLAFTSILALGLSWISWQEHHAQLALLFPWRITVLLVPLATAFTLALIVAQLERLAGIRWVAMLFTLISVGGAVVVYWKQLGYQTGPLEEKLFSFIRQDRKPGDLYLIPAKFPKATNSKGTSSASFVPLSMSSSAVFELQRFRLETGTPIYVDFKSIPYATHEVFEWNRRVADVEIWYATTDWETSGIVDQLKSYNISHVLLTKGHGKFLAPLQLVYSDDAFEVYRVN